MNDLSKKTIKQTCLEKLEIDDEPCAEEMKEALMKIAQEVQKYCSGDTSDETTDEVGIYKTKLEMKRKQIKSLKENLNTACMVAKTLTTSKEKECLILNKHLVDVRNEALSLQKKNVECTDTIQKLQSEKNILAAKIHQLKNFIELGYKELQKLRKLPEENLSTELQLKEIVVFCGQYYADYLNEHEMCVQLEQKNRFLTNKLNILERDLETANNELQTYRLSRKTKDSYQYKTKVGQSICFLNSEPNVLPQLNLGEKTDFIDCDKDFLPRERTLDLSRHMSLVKNLLRDQDTILADLKDLSQELQGKHIP